MRAGRGCPRGGITSRTDMVRDGLSRHETGEITDATGASAPGSWRHADQR
jgi:hypothetical protein